MEIICYAGGKGENPENTIEGIKHCVNVRPDWKIEIDLQMTRDGHIILFHDSDTYRITGVYRKTKELTLAEIRMFNAGYNFQVNSEYMYRDNAIGIPTLREVFYCFSRTSFVLDVHTRNKGAVDKIIEIVESCKMENRVVIVSRYDELLNCFKMK